MVRQVFVVPCDNLNEVKVIPDNDKQVRMIANRPANRETPVLAPIDGALTPTDGASDPVDGALAEEGGIQRNGKGRSSRMSKEEAAWFSAIKARFKKIAGQDKKISFEEFHRAIQVKDAYFAQKYFHYFDNDGSGYIDLDEFNQNLQEMLEQTDEQKLRFLFNLLDMNDDGAISKEELRRVMAACVADSDLQLGPEQLDSLVTALLVSADHDGDGTLSYDELHAQFQKYPSVLENLSISPANWLKIPPPTAAKKSRCKCPNLQRYFTMDNIQNNLPLLVFFTIYIGLNIGCFVLNVLRYSDSNIWVIIARGCGMCLNFNSAIIVLFMLRHSLTALRNTRVGLYLPIDHSILIHKTVAYAIAVFTVVHTIAHLVNIDIALTENAFNKTLTYVEVLFTTKAGLGWVYGMGYLSGVICFVILLVMVLSSLPIVRGSGNFQVFYWMHFLCILYWGMLIVHGPIFWYFFIVPGTMYLTEKIYGYILERRQSASTKFFITRVRLLPSRVINLVITRPDNFKFKPGDYAFVRIPDIAQWEWHPFTISSAPEMKGLLTMHIRCLGKWTNKLYDFYAKEKYLSERYKVKVETENQSENQLIEALVMALQLALPGAVESSDECGNTGFILDNRKIFLKGPYGTPAHNLTKTDHAIMIGAGIGVTPFASILQSLLIQNKELKKELDDPDGQEFQLKQVDFIWVNRNVKNFEWFLTLLTQLELEQVKKNVEDNFLKIHLYLTSAKTAADMKGVGLQMALELVHQQEDRDLLTGLKTRMQPGRPDWNDLFQKVYEQRKGRVHVYFCGSAMLAKVVQSTATKFGFQFSHSF